MSARGTALSMNIVWNSAIRGSSFLQASVKGIHSYSGKLEKINLLKATKFPVINRHLDSLNKNLRKLQQTSAKISRTPMDLGIEKSRNSLKAILRETKAVERATKQTAFYSQKDAENRLRAVRASRAEANALTRASKAQARKDKRRNVSAGAVVGTAMALAPLVMPLKSSFNFEEAITSVNAKTDTAYSKDIPLLRETAIKLGSSTEWTMTQVAKGEEYLTMAGFNPKQIAQAMKGNLALATVGDLDLGTSSDISSNILTGFNKKADEMDRVADVMAKTITTSNVNVVELGESMKYVGTIATSMRGKNAFLETTAMVGLLGNVGIKGTQAGTHLKGMYMRLAAPPKKAASAMDALHLKAFDAQGQAKPMHQIIGELNQKFKKYHYTQEQRTQALKDIFGMIALPSAMALLNMGEDKIVAYQNKIDKSTGEALRIQKMKLDTPIGQMKLFGSALEGLAITMTQELLPPFKDFMKVMTKGVNVVTAWAKEHPKLASAIYGTGIALGVATVALMTFGLVATFAGKGLSVLGFGRAKAGMIGLTGATKKATLASRIFGGVLRMSPLFLIGTLIAGAVFAFADLESAVAFGKSAILGFNDGLNALKATFSPVFEWFGKVSDKASDLAEGFGFAGWKAKEAGEFGFHFGQSLALIIPALIGAKVAGMALSFVMGSKLVTGLKMAGSALLFVGRALMANPIGLAVTAIAGGAILIYTYWDKIKPYFTRLWNGTKQIFNTAWNGIKSIVTTPVEFIKSAWMTTKTFFSTLWNGTKDVFGMAWSGITTVLTAPIVAVVMGWDATKNFLNNIWSGTKEIFSSAWDGITAVITSPITTIENMWNSLMKSIEDKLAWFSGAIEKVKSGWGAVKSFFSIGGDKEKVKANRDAVFMHKKALDPRPANNPLYDPKNPPILKRGQTLKDVIMKPKQVAPKPVLPKPVPHAMVESPTAVTAGHLAQNKVEVKNDHSQTHISNQYTIIAKGTDANEVLALIKQHERASATQKRDTQLKDAV